MFSVMRNVSVPIGIKIPGKPNIADTLWLTVSDQKNKVYYFQDTNSPSILWVNLSELDFKEGSARSSCNLTANRIPPETRPRTSSPRSCSSFWRRRSNWP